MVGQAATLSLRLETILKTGRVSILDFLHARGPGDTTILEQLVAIAAQEECSVSAVRATPPVAQFEKLWGDMIALSDVPSRFVVVPRERGQQLKDVAQLDGWVRDGSMNYVEGIAEFENV